MPEPDDANELVDAKPNGEEPLPEDADTTADDDTGDSDTGDVEPEPEPAAEPKVSDEDQKWLDLKASGVTPEVAKYYMAKGYDAEQAKAAEAAKKDGTDSGAEGDDEDVLPVSQGEFKKTMENFARQNVNTTQAIQVDATLEGMLDGSDFAEDDRSRQMIKDDAWKLVRGGTKPREAFRTAAKGHSSWLATRATATNKKKVAAKKAGGSSGDGAPATPTEPLNLEHKEDDFESGAAHDQAVALMRRTSKVG